MKRTREESGIFWPFTLAVFMAGMATRLVCLFLGSPSKPHFLSERKVPVPVRGRGIDSIQ